jgi:hypothetical protein
MARCWSSFVKAARVNPLLIHAPRTIADGLGVPLYIGITLWANRAAMRRDIRLWQRGLGDTPETNPDYWVRRRYSRLYIDYKPLAHWWRLVLIVRKGCLVAVSVRCHACKRALNFRCFVCASRGGRQTRHACRPLSLICLHFTRFGLVSFR